MLIKKLRKKSKSIEQLLFLIEVKMDKYIENIDEYTAIKLANELKNINMENQDSINFQFDDNVSCTPFGMLFIENVIKKLRKNYIDKKFKINLNPNAKSIRYAGHMGFFKSISENINFGKLPGEANGNNNYFPITKIDFINYTKKNFCKYMEPLAYIEYESRNLARVLAQDSKELEKLFTYMIREVIRNSQEHGKVNEAWICAQNWKNKNIAEISILDNGIGYKKSLEKKYGKIIKNDEKAIELALKPGVTESYKGKYNFEEVNSGFGLYVASCLCNELNGSFTILSGDTLIKKHNGTITTKKTYHEGSLISMSIDTTSRFNYNKLINEIVNKGEQEQKDGIKASELSKGKFIF